MHYLIEVTKAHEAVMGLFALAFIVTMPEQLPSFREVPAWLYGWLHDGLKTFVSFRSPGAQQRGAGDTAK